MIAMEANRIFLGDAFELVKRIPDGSVDLVLTSPPYGIGKEYEKRARTIEEYLIPYGAMIAEIKRALKTTGSVIWQVGFREEAGEQIPLSYRFLPLFRDRGFRLLNEIIWCFNNNKPFSGNNWRRLMPAHESALWMAASESYYFGGDDIRIPQKYPNKKVWRTGNHGERSCNPLGKIPGDWMEIPVERFNSPTKWDHPAQFPEELARRLILMACPRGGLVLDPFAGVGTTLKVAKDLGRDYLGFEKEPHYYNQAVLRLNGIDQKGQMSLDTDYDSVRKQLIMEAKE